MRETIGFFEEYIDTATNKCLGTRAIQDPGTRPLGHAGAVAYTWTSPQDLERGAKVVTIKATAARPVRVTGMAQRAGGRLDWRHPLE